MSYKCVLVPNREDRPRYAVLVSYEPGPMQDYGATMQAVRREWAWVSTGRSWKWMCVRVTVLRRIPGLRFREWPRNLEPVVETEALRRERILQIREKTHVDRDEAFRIPTWYTATGAPVPVVHSVVVEDLGSSYSRAVDDDAYTGV